MTTSACMPSLSMFGGALAGLNNSEEAAWAACNAGKLAHSPQEGMAGATTL